MDDVIPEVKKVENGVSCHVKNHQGNKPLVRRKNSTDFNGKKNLRYKVGVCAWTLVSQTSHGNV